MNIVKEISEIRKMYPHTVHLHYWPKIMSNDYFKCVEKYSLSVSSSNTYHKFKNLF